MTETLDVLAREIDIACDLNDAVALEISLDIINNFDRNSLQLKDEAALDLYAANIFANLHRIRGGVKDFAWSQPLLEKEIYHLRLALNKLGCLATKDLKTDLKLRIYTNLANTLNHVGRFVEAIELWDEAIAEHSNFGMAIGNRAQALFWYARFLDDPDEQTIFLKQSYVGFRFATATGVEEHAHEDMCNWVTHLESIGDWESMPPETPQIFKSTSREEQKYRIWCVNNRLVLNPINDLMQNLDGLQDTLTLPPITLSIKNGSSELPRPYAIFNQLKQEYASARYLIFVAIQEKDEPLHFADKGIVLYDTLDYRFYRLWVEKIKMAFLAAHAIFDKIAYLVNDYWGLRLNVKSINFNSIWYEGGRQDRGLASSFKSSQNWPLRGLYWLGKDFYNKSSHAPLVEPDAKIIHEIRNHIAHKYLRVHDHTFYGAAEERERLGHEISYPVSDKELFNHSIKLLKLARSALIYLSAAISHEEAIKCENSKSELIATMPITIVSDDYRL